MEIGYGWDGTITLEMEIRSEYFMKIFPDILSWTIIKERLNEEYRRVGKSMVQKDNLIRKILHDSSYKTPLPGSGGNLSMSTSNKDSSNGITLWGFYQF